MMFNLVVDERSGDNVDTFKAFGYDINKRLNLTIDKSIRDNEDIEDLKQLAVKNTLRSKDYSDRLPKYHNTKYDDDNFNNCFKCLLISPYGLWVLYR